MSASVWNRAAARDMLYLCGCALHGAVPDAARPAWQDLRAILELSRFHSLTALVCEALDRLPAEAFSEEEREVLARFREDRARAVRKNVMLDFERGKLAAYLEQAGIWYMPLKGVILKELYPGLGLRQMADNDILFDGSRREEVRDWFVGQGYRVESYGLGNHDVYLKAPIYNYEMHVSLYGERHSETVRTYYADVKSRLVSDGAGQYGYRFRDEDFYLYFLSHGFKHYDGGGTGVRFLVDLFVWLRARGAAMDAGYLRGELAVLGLSDFEADCRALSEAIFGDAAGLDEAALTAGMREMLAYFLTSGTYGTLMHSMDKAVRKEGRGRYLLRRIFPGRQVLAAYHPAFGKHVWLMPVGWVYRLVRQSVRRPGRVLGELRLWRRLK